MFIFFVSIAKYNKFAWPFLPKKNLHIKKTKKLYGVTVKINKFILFFLFFLKTEKLL